MRKYDYDLIVIGAGSGGISASILGNNLGKKVALVEKKRIGGECTWSGCVPSKTLIKSAQIAHELNHMKEYGLSFKNGFKLDTDQVMNHVRKIIHRVYEEEKPEVFEKMGIDVFIGSPQFLDMHRIIINEKEITSKSFIISTGSSPVVISFPGLEKISYLTNETIFEIKKLPEAMLILGGGPIGIEMASAFNRLGVKITVVQRSDILKKDDRELVEILKESLRNEGVQILTQTKAIQFSKQNGMIVLNAENQEKKRIELKADRVLFALGRKPNVFGLELEKAGIVYSEKGIHVNNKLQTTATNIYACGDVIGSYLFSHVAEYQASIAVRNAVLPLPVKKNIDYRTIPWATFTDPELAHSGLTENEARIQFGDKIKIYRHYYNKVDRAKTDLSETGVGKFIFSPNGKLIGIHILGERASELLHEAQLIKILNLSFSKIQSMIHIYPTFGDVVKRPANLYYADRLRNNFFIKYIQKLFSTIIKN
jgi:pyruvate/2-oxoglutarate dehydrogenase complex dihydrolipoamide dehydrogenase (E3) component